MKAFKKIAKRYYFKHILICALIELMLFYAPLPALLANPNPSPGTLPTGHSTPYGGVGSFDYTSGRLDIQNVSNGAVINWHKFDIGAGATTEFHQVSSHAYVLNRVSATDGMASGIKGTLLANGGVIIMNPRGIVFGPSALVNAGKFIASGLGISDSDFRRFANGTTQTLKFETGCLAGNVTNNGTINAGEAVYLVGKSVTNTGTISCPGGMVVMAAGDKVYLAQSGSNVVVEKLDTGSNAGDHRVTAGGTINATGAGVLLAAGDIFSQAAITNARSFVAQADRDITVDNPISASGDITLWADKDGDAVGNMYAGYNKVTHSVTNVPITAGGNIEIRGNDVRLGGAVSAGGNLTITGRDCGGSHETLWGNVYAYSTLHADGDIKISDTGEQKEWVDGHWEGRTWVEGYWKEGHCGHREWVCGHWEGGWYVPGYWDTSYAPGTIYLHDNVTAGGNLMLCNNTETFNDTGFGVRLQAGLNVILAEDGIADSQRDNCTFLHGIHNLEIVALNGRITNDSSLFDNPDAMPSMLGAPLTTISVEGSTLLMEQTPSFNLDNFTFANQVNTDLTLISHSGSVTAVETGTKPQNAADQWKSIGATANDDITLSGSTSIRSGESGTDLTKSLWAKNGNIDVRSGQDFTANKDIKAGSNITVSAGNNILLKGNATAGQNINLTAGADVEAQGNLTAGQDVTISSSDNTTYLGGNVYAGDSVLLNNNTQLNGAGDQSITAQTGTVLANGTIAKINEGRMSILAADGITLNDAASAQGSMLLDADTDEDGTGDMLAQSTLTTTTGNIKISASDTTIILNGDVSAGRDLILNNNTVVAGGKQLGAGCDVKVQNDSSITSDGDMMIDAGHDIILTGRAGSQGNMTLTADRNNENGGDVFAQDRLDSQGNINIQGNNITLNGPVTAAGKLTITGATSDDFCGSTNGQVTAYNILTSNGSDASGSSMEISGEDIRLYDTAYASGDMTLRADQGTHGGDGIGDVVAGGNLIADGSISIYASDNTIYLGGNVYAGEDILLNNNTRVNGYGDQTIEAGNKLTAEGFVRKCTFGDMYLIGGSEDLSIDLKYNGEGPGTSTYQGNLWILGQGDIQISDDVTTFGDGCIALDEGAMYGKSIDTGGVAIISRNGSIYTEGAASALDVSVTGNSDHFNGTGVYGFGLYTNGGGPTILSETSGGEARAAIAIVSADPLKLGANGRLEARGRYYSDGSVDDRAGIGFLDVDAEIPQGTPRNPGVPFDLAIYTASQNGSVEIDCPVMIGSSEGIPVPTILDAQFVGPKQEFSTEPAGAMVIDAYDKVVLGENFRNSLANGEVGDRLEVCSRITEWLEDAVGRLPFPDDLDLPQGYNYVMRGAGLENPEITDGRAWVLERKENIEPFTAAAPIQQPELKFMGCPAVVNWVAKELGVERDQIQLYFEGAMAMSGDVQPCETCANLKNTALVLMDTDGTKTKALAQIVNEFAPAGAPPSEEQMALIATAMNNPQEGSRYALAAQWLDALAQYVNILHKDFNLPANESTAYAAKYATPIMTGDNTALAAYVQAKLTGLGG